MLRCIRRYQVMAFRLLHRAYFNGHEKMAYFATFKNAMESAVMPSIRFVQIAQF